MCAVIGFCLSAVFVLSSAAAAAAELSETFSCSYGARKGCTSGTAVVEVSNGLVQRVSFDNFFCGLPGKAGYSCLVESSRGGGDRWQQEEGRTRIDFGSPSNPDQPDSLTLSVRKDRIELDFSDAQSAGRCGAGAELPKSVTIHRRSGKCRVRL